MNGYRPEELLITTIAAMLQGVRHVAVGASSPIPGAAALLTREHAQGRVQVSILGREADNFFTDGSRELFDCAAQGRIDAFFLGGAQIDGSANVNLVGIGGYPRSKVRFPGSFGSAYLYLLVPRVILFTTSHTRRVLVPRVDFISAAGVSPKNVYRTGGPYALVTDRCVFMFEQDRFRLSSLHPGHTLEEIRENTGFEFDVPRRIAATTEPDAESLRLLRGRLGASISEVYPAFAAKVLGVRPPTAA